MLAPKKRFGQHFLHDPQTLRRIVNAFAPRRGETIVEIGPGRGALTGALIEAAGRLHAIELDRDLASRLRTQYPDASSLQLYQADALRFDFCALQQGAALIRIIGNLPYNISTPLLFHLFTQRACISDCCFMLQKEVVQRLAAAPDTEHYGRLSVMAQLYCDIEPLFDVGPGAFTPPPKVESSVVRLRPHATAPVAVDETLFAAVVKAAFSQRRKTLRNTLKALVSAQAMQEIGIDPQRRAETLSLEEFARLSQIAQPVSQG